MKINFNDRQINKENQLTRISCPTLDNILGWEFPVLDHGFIRVIDYMGDDSSVVQAARTSYGAGTRKMSDDENLIQYLLRNQHTTPFEMVSIKLHVKLPIFVARQWIRHRMAHVNEYSARYSILDKEFYIPPEEALSKQSKTNKQGRSNDAEGAYPFEDASAIQMIMEDASMASYADYELLIKEGEYTDEDNFKLKGKGLSRELARIVLPTNIYTQWYWKTDLHNLMRFIKLRADPHAQQEIRVYAMLIQDIVERWLPMSMKAFKYYIQDSVSFSDKELESFSHLFSNPKGVTELDSFINLDPDKFNSEYMTKREWGEFVKKLKIIKSKSEFLMGKK